MAKALYTATDVSQLIRSNKVLALAGDRDVLARLPKGTWIGGSIPYFIGEEGGVCSRELIHVTEIPSQKVTVTRYDAHSISRVYEDGANAGFSLIIIPAQSTTHVAFALHAPSFPRFAHRPLIGWIAGLHLSDLGKATARVFDGSSGEEVEDGAVVLHAHLDPGKLAEISIINIFEMGEGPDICFSQDGFEVSEALINGQRRNLAKWLEENKADTRLPLVANYLGTSVNVSLQSVDAARGVVRFYAPVFAGVTYHHARPVNDYVSQFRQQVPPESGQVMFSCNCILNYLYSQLEGKRTGSFTGPVTFGEIAYQLLNQTMVYLAIRDASQG